MTKEDLNRRFGDPERQKPITPPDLLAAAHLIREFCNSVPHGGCMKCIFNNSFYGCHLFEMHPDEWELSEPEHKTADLIDKQYFNGRSLYTDTDEGGKNNE